MPSHIHSNMQLVHVLKRKFSSGIESALASTIKSEMILCICCNVFKVYLINIDPETAAILIKGDFEFWSWASHFIMI